MADCGPETSSCQPRGASAPNPRPGASQQESAAPARPCERRGKRLRLDLQGFHLWQDESRLTSEAQTSAKNQGAGTSAENQGASTTPKAQGPAEATGTWPREPDCIEFPLTSGRDEELVPAARGGVPAPQPRHFSLGGFCRLIRRMHAHRDNREWCAGRSFDRRTLAAFYAESELIAGAQRPTPCPTCRRTTTLTSVKDELYTNSGFVFTAPRRYCGAEGCPEPSWVRPSPATSTSYEAWRSWLEGRRSTRRFSLTNCCESPICRCVPRGEC